MFAVMEQVADAPSQRMELPTDLDSGDRFHLPSPPVRRVSHTLFSGALQGGCLSTNCL